MLISTAQVLSGSEDVYVVCVKTTNSMYSLRQVILFGYNCIFVSLSGASTSLLLGLGLAFVRVQTVAEFKSDTLSYGFYRSVLP